MFISAVRWGESAICVHVWPPSEPCHPPCHIPPPRSSQQHKLSSCAVGSLCFPLAVCFTHSSVSTSAIIFQFVLPSPLFLPSLVHICVLYACISVLPRNRSSSTICLDSNICVNIRYLFFPLINFILVWQISDSPTSLQMTQFHSFYLARFFRAAFPSSAFHFSPQVPCPTQYSAYVSLTCELITCWALLYGSLGNNSF